MNDVLLGLFAWAVTATVAAVYYWAKHEKDKTVAMMTIHAMREVARGKATTWIDDDDNLRIKAND